MSDLFSILLWWFMILVIGGIATPVTIRLFHAFVDRGYIFSKVIGIFAASYVVWLLGSVHVLPFSHVTIVLVLIGWMLLNVFVFRSQTGKLPWRFIILEEVLFLAAIAFWSYVRATEPSIHGLEKFMDFGFVNSILRSEYFPPLDMWLAKSPEYSGHFINYYYYGHYYSAFLTKLSGIDSAITYNLMIATLFAFTFTLSFSLGLNMLHLFRKNLQLTTHLPAQAGNLQLILCGLLAAFLVSLGGNLHTVYIFTPGYTNFDQPNPPWELSFAFNPEKYWYPNATRFIPNTIHEFPIYSFVVSDLHGHVLDIPFVFLILAVLLIILASKHPEPLKHRSSRSGLQWFLYEFEMRTSVTMPVLSFLGILLAGAYMTNAWDGMIYMIITGMVILYRNVTRTDSRLTSVLYRTFSASLYLLFAFLLGSLPFSFNFKPFVSGIGMLCAPSFLEDKIIGPLMFEKDHCQQSPLYQLITLWGFFYFAVAGFLLFNLLPLWKRTAHQLKHVNSKLHVPELAIIAVAVAAFSLLVTPTLIGNITSYTTDSGSPGQAVVKIIAIPLLLIALIQAGRKRKALQSFLRKLPPTDAFALILIIVSTLLISFSEFFYLKDIYPAHYRANTMFKLGYQAFMMLGIVSAYVFFRIGNREHPNTKLPITHDVSNSNNQKSKLFGISNVGIGSLFGIWKLGFLILFAFVAVYPYFAITSYYDRLKTYHGLYGLNWLQTQFPDDYNAIIWLRENVSGHPVIAEANGDSYTDYDRVSANTGLPTIVGWPVHEWLWRGSYDEAGKRIPEVETIYNSPDIEATRLVIDKYDVAYIFVGNLEREKYKELQEDKLQQLGTVVYESGETKIYRMNR